MKSFKPTMVIVGGWDLGSNWLLTAECVARKIPRLLWIESLPGSNRLRNSLKGLYAFGATGALVPGRSAAETAQRLTVPVLARVPNSVAGHFLRPLSAAAATRKALFVGALNERKGADLVIRNADVFASRGWTLTVVGDGPLRPLVAAAAARLPGTVTYRGELSSPGLLEEYDSAACLLLPSRSDPWPLVAAEATARGLPILFGDGVGSSADLLEEHPASCVVNPSQFDGKLGAFLDEVQRHGRTKVESANRATLSPGGAAAAIHAAVEASHMGAV